MSTIATRAAPCVVWAARAATAQLLKTQKPKPVSRDAWWPAFQLASGRLLVDALAEDGEPLANLNGLYQGSRG